MTGFGRGEAKTDAKIISVEMRSVNNRYLDVQVKLPRSLAAFEPRVRKAVQERFSRGRIDVFVNRAGGDSSPFRLVLDHRVAEQYVSLLREAKVRYGLSGEIDIALFGGLPELVTREDIPEDADMLWGLLERALSDAMTSLHAMRQDEGSALGRDIAGRLDSIESLTDAIRERAPASVETARKRMTESLDRILKEPPDPTRVAQEIAILAERTDVTEELIRLKSHLAQFRRLLGSAGQEPVGRKLDFLLQELGREFNTVASKALDAEISLQVVTGKAELEKVREQVQNIE
jgi:uncharacterized protein (TIGR00255 family)